MTREVRRIDYPNGGWCLQDYEDGELHGAWRVFYPNGSVSWERSYEHGFLQGVARSYDETGRLRQEQWFVDDALHGPWTSVDADGKKSVREFLFGYPVETLRDAKNAAFRESILPLLNNAFAPTRESARTVLESLRKPTIALHSGAPVSAQERSLRSYMGHVTVLAGAETWPEKDGHPLSPILQVVASELPQRSAPWDEIDAVTIFAEPDNVPMVLGRDIVVRVYRPGSELRAAEPPAVDPVCSAHLLEFSAPSPSYPDANDLPPCLENLVRRHASLVKDADRLHLASRLSGWPGWIQSTRIVDLGRFALQLDSLEFENWSCGDCAIHYFFERQGGDGFDWRMEMT